MEKGTPRSRIQHQRRRPARRRNGNDVRAGDLEANFPRRCRQVSSLSRRQAPHFVFEKLVDLSSHNTNPPGVFDGEAVHLSDVADTRIEESVAALREFVAEHGSLPTVESWTEAAMRPSEKTIRR